MSRESMGGYIPPEETKKKKRETEMELAEIVVESASFSALGTNISLEKVSASAEIMNAGASSAISGKIELVKKTEEYGRIYEMALDKTEEANKKRRKEKNKKENRVKNIQMYEK